MDEKQLAQGEVDLANGGAQLADGKQQLSVFEEGCAKVAAGCELLMSQPAYMNDEGNGDKVMCPSVADILKERYGDNFSIWDLDDNGEIRVVNGCQYLNLENCRAVGQAGHGDLRPRTVGRLASFPGRCFLGEKIFATPIDTTT